MYRYKKKKEEVPYIEIKDTYIRINLYIEDLEDGYVSFYSDVMSLDSTNDDIKNFILTDIRTTTDKKILTGYYYKDNMVWLSKENQFNYKAVRDLAVETSGSNLPVTFKFGYEDYPVYYEFKTVEELDEFYKGMINHITSTVKEGWDKKNSINWDNYKLPEFENKERKEDL